MADFSLTETEAALNIREKLARIDEMLAHNEQMRRQMLADETLNGARLNQMSADHDRKRQEIRYAPWVLVLPVIVGSLTAGAALFAAGAAFVKLFP